MIPKFLDELLHQHVVNSLLVIGSPDKQATDRLVGFLSEVRGAGGGNFKDATVTTLEDAGKYIEAYTPNIVIIDPEVAPPTQVLDFVELRRKSQPRVVWVVYLDLIWWTENKLIIDGHRFGQRFRNYYVLDKEVADDRIEQEITDVLRLCYRDIILQLLAEAVDSFKPGGRATQQQIEKFANKAIDLNIPLLISEKSEREAFVSMRFTPAQEALYESAIRPLLEKRGFKPIMMLNERSVGPIPIDISTRIANCSLFVADLTELRPDVFIEIGLALNRKVPMILLRGPDVKNDQLPFIIRNDQITTYTSLPHLKLVFDQELKLRT